MDRTPFVLGIKGLPFVIMPNCPSILIYGNDSTLLETRRLVLEKDRHDIYVSTELSEVERLAATTNVSLLILCHTLTRQESIVALIATHLLLPELKRLLLTDDDYAYPSEGHLEILSAFTGPRELISAVRRLSVTHK